MTTPEDALEVAAAAVAAQRAAGAYGEADTWRRVHSCG